MKTLKLFNAVIAKKSKAKPFVSDKGFVIEPNAIWAKNEVVNFYNKELLDGNELNKTFHKSWAKVKNSDRAALAEEQIKHYISTYGSDFSDEIYIPEEVLNVPNVKVNYKVIKGYSETEMIEKCLDLLRSGIAMNGETLDDILSILVDELNYTFTGNEGIKNKEAVIKIADMYGVLPNDTMEFFRYIIYRSTGDSLLIKNRETIAAINYSSFNPATQFKQFGLERLAEIFNRFKPLFLAYKSKCGKTINRISKLSKKYHKPMVTNPLSMVTSMQLTTDDNHWLDNATPFALFKALHACHTRMNDERDTFVYRVRNGKSFTKDNVKKNPVVKYNFDFIARYMKTRFDLTNTKIFLPEDVKFGLPTSEKMFVGNIPTGTRFYGKRMAVGVYWEDAWGARDLDLSGINIGGKVGWNSSYSSGNLTYSGDITSAPNGAVEYLHADKGLSEPTIVMNNVFSGAPDAGYKIVIGKGSDVSRDFMMNPNKVFADIKTNSVQKQTVLGMVIPKKDEQCFVLLNFGAGQANVSGYGTSSLMTTKALYQEWSKPFSFNKLIKLLGAEVVDNAEDADFDFSLDKLEKDSFTKLFINV